MNPATPAPQPTPVPPPAPPDPAPVGGTLVPPPAGPDPIPGQDTTNTTYNSRVDQVHANNAQFGNVGAKYDNCSFQLGTIRFEELSAEHFQACSTSELERLLKIETIDRSAADRLVTILTRYRVAVVVGEPDVGKGMLARLASARLRDVFQPPPALAETLPLGAEVRAPLGKLGAGVWLFRDFLSTRNRDLLSFIAETDSMRLGSLAESLRTRESFLLFTSDESHLADQLPHLEGLGVVHRASAPARELLARVLERKVADTVLPQRVDEVGRQRVGELLKVKKDQILEALRTPPRVVRFVDRYLLKVAVGGMPLEQALDRLDDLGDWLLRELAVDLETWSFALALILAQSRPPAVGAPWQQAHSMARAIARYLRRVLREPRGNGTVIADESRLERLHAEVRRLPFPGVDLIRFKDDSYPERLWQVLLGPGREVLSLLIPLLRNLAEEPDEGGFALRFAAAQALGRCGEMDAFAITFPLLAGWSQSSREADHLALGHLLQGVLASPDESFRNTCLGQIRRRISIALGDKAWAPAVALREVGINDLPLALGGLILLAQVNLQESDLQMDGTERAALRDTEDVVRAVFLQAKSRGEDPPELGEQFRSLMTAALCGFEKEPQEALAAIQYALVGLCFLRGPVTVLQELDRQLAESENGILEPLLVLWMLRQNGIIDILERNLLILTPDSSALAVASPPGASRFLVEAAAESTGSARLAALLATCYLRCGVFPGTFARALRARLLDLLCDWAHQGAANAAVRSTVKTLLARLLRCDVAELKEEVFRLLREAPDLTAVGSDSAGLAREALLGKLD
jgi:hypothetical protein